MHLFLAWFRRRSLWVRRLILFVAAVSAVGTGLWFIPTGYYITAPGAAIDTSRLIAVEKGTEHPDRLFMLVVATQPANLFWYLYAKLDPRADLETPREFLGGVENYDQYLELTREMMVDSKAMAQAIALQQLGYGQGVRTDGAVVATIRQEAPARSVLKVGDTIVAVAGKPVTASGDVFPIMRTLVPGEPVTVRVVRQGRPLELSVPTMANPDAERKGTAALGVTLLDHLVYDLPIPIEMASGEITGPSAGLMFTLQIIDQLTPGGLVGDMVIAGTGTIEPDGSVGAIGGVQQKVYTAEAAGAAVMFVPRANYDLAREVATRIELVPVGHIREALDWIHANRK